MSEATFGRNVDTLIAEGILALVSGIDEELVDTQVVETPLGTEEVLETPAVTEKLLETHNITEELLETTPLAKMSDLNTKKPALGEATNKQQQLLFEEKLSVIESAAEAKEFADTVKMSGIVVVSQLVKEVIKEHSTPGFEETAASKEEETTFTGKKSQEIKGNATRSTKGKEKAEDIENPENLLTVVDIEDLDTDMRDIFSNSDDPSYTPEHPITKPTKATNPPTKTPAKPAITKRTPKTPLNRAVSGAITKTPSTPTFPTPSTPGSTESCPVEGCTKLFHGRNPRQSLWHHLKYYASSGQAGREEYERLHREAHQKMKEDAKPKGTPIERNRISSADYRRRFPEKAKTSARLSNFRLRARKGGATEPEEIDEKVKKWEREWQERQTREASEYFSGILMSAFE